MHTGNRSSFIKTCMKHSSISILNSELTQPIFKYFNKIAKIVPKMWITNIKNFSFPILLFIAIYFVNFSYSKTSSESSSESGSVEDIDGSHPNCKRSGLTSYLRDGTASVERIKRASHKKHVVVCVSPKDSSVNVHSNHGYGHNGKMKHRNHHHHHSQSEEEDEDDEDNDSSDEEDDDSDETVEEGGSANPSDATGGKHHTSGGSNRPPKGGKGRRKDRPRVLVEERFSNRNWSSEWVHAKNPNNSTKLYNKFSRVYARKSNHSKPNYGIITHNKGGEFYLIAKTFPPFNNRNDTLILQFSIQFQSKAHCQLAFLRLYDCQFSTDEFTIMTPYVMQVGPHVCGTSRLSRLSAEFQEPGKTTIKSVDKHLEAVNNVSVTVYALALEPDGTYRIFINTNAVQNGTLKDEFQSYKGYTGICGVGLAVWHSVLDKYFKGQMIIDDILVVNKMEYAEKRRKQILNLYAE